MGRRLLIDYSKNTAPLHPLGDDSNGSLVGQDRLGMSMRFHERVMANDSVKENGGSSSETKSKLATSRSSKNPKTTTPSAIYPLESLLASLSSIKMPLPEPEQPRPQREAEAEKEDPEEYTPPKKILSSLPSLKITFRLPPRRRHRIARSHAKLYANDDANRSMEDTSHRSHYTTATTPVRGMLVDDRSSRTDNSRTISVCTAPAVVSRQRSAPASYQTIPPNRLREMQEHQQKHERSLQEQSDEEVDDDDDEDASFLPSSLASPAAPVTAAKKKNGKRRKRNVSLDDFFRKNNRDGGALDNVKEDDDEDEKDDIPKQSISSRSTSSSRRKGGSGKRGSSRAPTPRRKPPNRSKSFDDSSSFASMSQMSLSQMSLSEMSQSRPIGKRGKRIMPRATKSFNGSKRTLGDTSVNASSSTRRGGRRPNRRKDETVVAGEEGKGGEDKAPPPLRRMPSRSKSSCDGFDGSYRLMRQDSGFSFMAGSRIRIRTAGEGSSRSVRTSGRSSRSQRLLRSRDDSDDNNDDDDASTCSDMSQSYPQGRRSRRDVRRGVGRAKSCENMESMLGFLRS